MKDATSAPRRRGRPRGGPSGAPERILAAAAAEFGEVGYDAATIRSIATRAGVDAALVHHYFGTKSALFATVVDFPVDPATVLPSMLGDDLDVAGERVARFIVTTWDDPEFRARGVAVIRAAIGSRASSELMVGFFSREILLAISGRLGPDAESERRAGLVASAIIGLVVARYVLELPPMARMPVDEVVSAFAPTIQRYLTGPLDPRAD